MHTKSRSRLGPRNSPIVSPILTSKFVFVLVTVNTKKKHQTMSFFLIICFETSLRLGRQSLCKACIIYVVAIQNDRMFFCFTSLCLHHDNHSISMKNDKNKACIAAGIIIKSRLIVKPFAHMS